MKNFVLPFCIFLCVSTPTFSEESPTRIIITGTQSEEKEITNPVSIAVISDSDIEQSGATSLVEVLRSQASIIIKDNIGDGSRAYVTMRGFGANSVNNILIVVDGRKLNNPTLEAPLLSSISLKDIERIEILQGSGAVLYGDQAVGGVVNIITKKFQDNRLVLETTQGSNDLKAYKVSGSQLFDVGLGYRLSAEKKQSDNYRDNNDADYQNIYAEVSYDAGWGNVFYEYSEVDDKLNLAGFLTNAQISQNPQQSGNTEEFFNNDITIERVGLAYYINSNLTVDAVLSSRDSNGDVNNFGFSFQDTRVQMADIKLLGDWLLPQGSLKLTAGYEQVESDYQKSGFFTRKWENSQDAWYAQVIYPVAKGVTVVGGYRFAASKDNNLIDDESNQDDVSATEFGINYKNNRSRYFTRRAEAFRFGNADENNATASDVDFLDPQMSVSYEAGYEYSGKTFLFSTLVYSMKIDDEIYYDRIERANVNLDQSQRDGMIFEIEKKISNQFTLGAGYTFSDAEYTSGNFNGNTVPGSPEQTATLFSSYKINSALTFYVDAVYTGSRYPDSDDGNTSSELGAYTLTNANISWRNRGRGLNFRINNLGDKQYSSFLFSSGGYPAPGRTYELSLSYELF
ncbi:MAG: iron complex outermembrane receptor protein [Cellvibrionaceae bacterium]|jgi:iron complex outermembrane receptor protein